MRVLRHTDADYATALQGLVADSSLFDLKIEQRTRDIVEQVRSGGDAALVELTARFDKARLTPAQLAVGPAEVRQAGRAIDAEVRSAVALARRNIQRFSKNSLRRNWSTRNAQGARVGEKFDPFRRVGVYIPGGTAPLVSTALMTILLAQVAGCPEIVVCTPCQPEGKINPALLYAVSLAGATEIYRVGGAQAIAALALGTASILPVQKIFGPGNAYVVAAKRLLFGRAAIDLLPGPSEVLVLADDSADPEFASADLLAQAEHGSGEERVWLVTPSGRFLERVEQAICRQLPLLSRRPAIEQALAKRGALIQVASLEEGIRLTNGLAPEHCEIMTRNPAKVAERITSAGALFLGSWSPTVLGDYVAGPSHTLPTGGAGASFSGLTVDMFQRRTSVVIYDRAALRRSMRAVATFAQLEGLDAHGRSAAIRLDAPKAGPGRSKR